MASKKKQKKQAAKQSAPSADAASNPATEAASEQQASSQPAQLLVQVEYKNDNVHVLNHVHALGKGTNTLPAEVWAAAKVHPSIVAMLASGEIVELDAAADDSGEEEEEENDGGNDADLGGDAAPGAGDATPPSDDAGDGSGTTE